MTVLQLLGSAIDGGAETYFTDLTRGLAAAGTDQVAVIRAHAARQSALQDAQIPTTIARFGSQLDLFTKGKVRTVARASRAKVLLAWMNRAASHAPSGPWARIGRLGGYYDLKYYRGFDALVANTRDITDWILAQGWPQDRVHYIPNFAEAGSQETVDRASLDTPSDVPLLLSMGRLHEVKAHDISLKALALIPQAYLWIAGTGPLEAELKALAQSLGVADRVRFLGWRNDAAALYRTADACLFPSRFEPLGNVVIQCWANGLPVIAAASQGPSQLIRPGQDGLLVPIDDAPALATAARRVLAEPALRDQMVQQGLIRMDGEFSKAAVIAQWQALFAHYGDRPCAP
jgi:glycosyltransferase involved in cell wall biosynthesis